MRGAVSGYLVGRFKVAEAKEGWWAEGAGFSRMAAVGVEGTQGSNEAAIRRSRGRRAPTRSGIMQSRF